MTPERIEELKEESRYAKNHSGTITLGVAEFDELLEAACFKPETAPFALPSFEPIGIEEKTQVSHESLKVNVQEFGFTNPTSDYAA